MWIVDAAGTIRVPSYPVVTRTETDPPFQPATGNAEPAPVISVTAAEERQRRQGLTDAAAETDQRIEDAQAETERLRDLYAQGASQQEIDEQSDKVNEAWGAVERAAAYEMRLNADPMADADGAKEAAERAAADIKERHPDDDILALVIDGDEEIDGLVDRIPNETTESRETGLKAFEYELAVGEVEDAQAAVDRWNDLPGGIRNDPSNGPSPYGELRDAQERLQAAEDALLETLQHEIDVEAARLHLENAENGVEALENLPGGIRNAEMPSAISYRSEARSQYEGLLAGDEGALTTITDQEQEQATENVRQRHETEWFVGLVDYASTRGQFERELANVDPDDPLLTDQERELARNDPVSFVLLQMTGERVDPDAPGLVQAERDLARENPVAFAMVQMTGADIDPLSEDLSATDKQNLEQMGPLLYAFSRADRETGAEISLLMEVTADVRLEYTTETVAQHVRDGDPEGALSILNTNMNAAFTADQRQALWDQAGAPQLGRDFIEQNIDRLMEEPDPTATDTESIRAQNDTTLKMDKVGTWMQQMTADAPPEFASLLLDVVRSEFDGGWYDSNAHDSSGMLPRGTEFFKGLSQAVAVADQFSEEAQRGEPGPHARDVAEWLTDEEGEAAGLLPTLRGGGTSLGFDSVRETVGDGHGATLSQAIAAQLGEDDPFSYEFNLMLDQGLERMQGERYEAVAEAQYQQFQLDPDEIVQTHFDDYRRHYDGEAHELQNGNQLDNFVATALGMQTDDPALMPTTADGVPSSAALLQMVADGRFSDQSLFEDNEDAMNVVRPVADKIREVGGDNPTVTLVPILYVHDSAGVQPTALFKVTNADGETQYIDDRGWVYDDLDDYRHNNALADNGRIYLARDMADVRNSVVEDDSLTVGDEGDGTIYLDGEAVNTGATPIPAPGALSSAAENQRANDDDQRVEVVDFSAHITTGWDRALQVGEIVLGVAATAAGVVLIASGVGAPIGGTLIAASWTVVGASMALGGYVAIDNLDNLRDHGQSIGLGNPQARSSWISLFGTTAGALAGGFGQTARLFSNGANMFRTVDAIALTAGRTAQYGDEIAAFSRTSQLFANSARVTGGLSMGAGIQLTAEQGTNLLSNWDQMTPAQRAEGVLFAGLGVAQIGTGTRSFSHAMQNRFGAGPAAGPAAAVNRPGGNPGRGPAPRSLSANYHPEGAPHPDQSSAIPAAFRRPQLPSLQELLGDPFWTPPGETTPATTLYPTPRTREAMAGIDPVALSNSLIAAGVSAETARAFSAEFGPGSGDQGGVTPQRTENSDPSGGNPRLVSPQGEPLTTPATGRDPGGLIVPGRESGQPQSGHYYLPDGQRRYYGPEAGTLAAAEGGGQSARPSGLWLPGQGEAAPAFLLLPNGGIWLPGSGAPGTGPSATPTTPTPTATTPTATTPTAATTPAGSPSPAPAASTAASGPPAPPGSTTPASASPAPASGGRWSRARWLIEPYAGMALVGGVVEALPQPWQDKINAIAFATRGASLVVRSIFPNATAVDTRLGRILRGVEYATYTINVPGSFLATGEAMTPGSFDLGGVIINGTFTLANLGYGPKGYREARTGRSAYPHMDEWALPLYLVGSVPYTWRAAGGGSGSALLTGIDVTAGTLFVVGSLQLGGRAIYTHLRNPRHAESPAVTPVAAGPTKRSGWALADGWTNGIAYGGGLLLFGIVTWPFATQAGQTQQNPTPPQDEIEPTPPDEPVEPPEEPGDEQPRPQLVVLAPEGLNLRAAPSTGAPVLGVFLHGTFVTETGRRETDGSGNQWVAVSGPAGGHGEQDGWVRADYLEEHSGGAMGPTGRINPTLEDRGNLAVVVVPGDTIGGIANTRGRDVTETVLLNMDHIVNPDIIFPGDRVYLPDAVVPRSYAQEALATA